MVVSLNHVGIVVPELDKGVAFYKEWLGLADHVHFEWDQSNDRFGDIVDSRIAPPKRSF